MEFQQNSLRSPKPCDPNSIVDYKSCNFKVYNDSTTAVVPLTNCNISFCGNCPYTISLESPIFNKTVNGSMWAPFQQNFQVFTFPKTNYSENLTFVTDLSFGILSDVEQCIMNNDCVYVGGDKLEIPTMNGTLQMYVVHKQFGGINITIVPISIK